MEDLLLSRASDACFGLHFYETALCPGEQVFFTEQLREAVRLLDEELHYVITTSGWPTWETHGSGTGSRHRCGGEDDWVNTRWAALFHLLPKYQMSD